MCNTANDVGCDGNVQLTTGKVVKKENGFSTLDQNIVHTHRDEVLADGVVFMEMERQFELGSNAISARHHDRVPVLA